MFAADLTPIQLIILIFITLVFVVVIGICLFWITRTHITELNKYE